MERFLLFGCLCGFLLSDSATVMSNPYLSERIQRIQPSPTLAVDARAKELKAAGEDVCGFGAGEPDFGTPDFIVEAGVEALRGGKTRYAPAPGLPELRAALARKYREENGLAGCEPAQVIVSPGGKYSCFLAIQAVCNPGDEVLLPVPYWVSYPEMIRLSEGTPVLLPAGPESGYRVTAEQVREAITDRTRLLILNSPNNPTGAVYPPEWIREIVEVCAEKDVLLLSDEIYEDLLYGEAEHLSPASLSDRAAEIVLTVAGFSKTYAMTGWRLGTLVAPPAIAKAIASYQSQTTSNATTFAQYGALAALEQRDRAKEAVAGMREVFDRRRLRLLEGLRAIDGIECFPSEGAFYLFPDIGALGVAPADFARRLLDQQLVAVVAGEGFGSDRGIRLSYATADETIEKGLERLANFVRSGGYRADS